jgi:hypothetical protein
MGEWRLFEFIVFVSQLYILSHQLLPDNRYGWIGAYRAQSISNRTLLAFEFRECQQQHRQIAPISTGFGISTPLGIRNRLAGDQIGWRHNQHLGDAL